MTEHVARIRPYRASDERVVRFALGKSNLESLAVANHRGARSAYNLCGVVIDLSCLKILACTHPLTIALWLGLSSIFIEYMRWWPKNAHGLMGFLTPLPAIAAMAVPIMFLVDW